MIFLGRCEPTLEAGGTVWTLADLLERLGDYAVVVHNPDTKIQLGAVLLPEDLVTNPAVDGAPSPRHVLLAAGVHGDDLTRLAATATASGCAVLIARGFRSTVATRADGCAVVELAPNISWVEVIRLLDQMSGENPSQPTYSLPEGTVGDLIEGDLFALADALAERVGGPVIIEDANFQVLSYSSFVGPTDKGRDQTILGRRMTYEWLTHLESTGDLDILRSTDGVVEVVGGPMQARRRLIAAIRTPTQFLGILWVAEGATTLPADAAELVRQAASIAVSHLERHYVVHEAERRGRGQLVRSLIEGSGQVHRLAEEIGIERNAETAVLAFTSANSLISSERMLDRIADHVSLCCAAFRWQSAVCRIGMKVFAIVVIPSDGSREGLMRLGGEIVNRVIPALRTVLVGTASSSGRGLSTIPAGRRDAEEALSALLESENLDRPRFVSAHDVRPLVILREVLQIVCDRADLELPGLVALAQEDRLRDTEYVYTLRVYLEEHCNMSAASRRLSIHPTTLRYRLSRIKELSGLDVGDSRVRLCCELLLAAQTTR
jgi:sugar diacid utilization regulator